MGKVIDTGTVQDDVSCSYLHGKSSYIAEIRMQLNNPS